MIAALFVAADGPYAHLPDVELWTEGKSRLDVGFHTSEERAIGKARGLDVSRGEGRLSSRECWETPIAFRDLLLSMAGQR